jgi:hypothetical protein
MDAVAVASKKPRQNTKLESAGAEFMVLGMLLVEGILSFKAYTNFPGYDLAAVNPQSRRSARIQVKSRWQTDYDKSFTIGNFDCDFVVLAALNLGIRFRKSPTDADGKNGRKSPQFYCFPVEVVRKAAQNGASGWGGKVRITKIDNLDCYKDAWHLIREFIE